MAETLGSLVDKLTIKNLREACLKELAGKKGISPAKKKQLTGKLKILKFQQRNLAGEIEEFIIKAVRGEVVLLDQKLKLYNRPGLTGKKKKLKVVSAAISGLSLKNIELWRLEDQARQPDAGDADIGRVKKKIDRANQERNDLIDTIDQLLKKYIKEHR